MIINSPGYQDYFTISALKKYSLYLPLGYVCITFYNVYIIFFVIFTIKHQNYVVDSAELVNANQN